MNHSDVDLGDLESLRRLVVEPLIAEMFKPGEIAAVHIQIGLPEPFNDDPQSTYVGVSSTDGDSLWHRLGPHSCRAGIDDLASDLEEALQDWLCETKFGWGQVRTRDYRLFDPDKVIQQEPRTDG